jgi:MazG family protein
VDKAVASCGDHFDRLILLVERLRGHGGCPWDRAQTPETIKVYLIEETYEVLEALESGDTQNVCGELGDLLFQIVFLARMFRETGDFNMEDVLRRITEKMIRRHPHVFGDDKVSDSEEVRHLWHEVKIAEAKDNDTARQSCLDSVPEKLPALMRAYRLGERAARVGFDWPDLETVLVRVEEALAQFKDSLRRDDREKSAERFGDLLFAVASVSRFIGVHPETALAQTISTFVKRIHKIEKALREEGRTLESISPEEMADIWERCERDRGTTERHGDP